MTAKKSIGCLWAIEKMCHAHPCSVRWARSFIAGGTVCPSYTPESKVPHIYHPRRARTREHEEQFEEFSEDVRKHFSWIVNAGLFYQGIFSPGGCLYKYLLYLFIIFHSTPLVKYIFDFLIPFAREKSNFYIFDLHLPTLPDSLILEVFLIESCFFPILLPAKRCAF